MRRLLACCARDALVWAGECTLRALNGLTASLGPLMWVPEDDEVIAAEQLAWRSEDVP